LPALGVAGLEWWLVEARARRPMRMITGTWLPFGGGTRRCLGASFATFEMRVVIRQVLERSD